MNSTELINRFRDKITENINTIYPRKELEPLIDSFLDVISESLNKNESVVIKGLGKFSIKIYPPRRFYNLPKRQFEMTKSKREIVSTASKHGKLHR